MNVRHSLIALKTTAVAIAFAASATVGLAAPAAHANGIVGPIGGGTIVTVCDPSLDPPTLVGAVAGQFQVRGIGHCFSPGHFAFGQMFDSQGHTLDGSNFVVYPNGDISYIMYVAPYSGLYCGWLGISVKFTDTANGRTTSRVICTPQLVAI